MEATTAVVLVVFVIAFSVMIGFWMDHIQTMKYGRDAYQPRACEACHRLFDGELERAVSINDLRKKQTEVSG